MPKQLLLLILPILLFSCYNKWQELDLYAGKISCDDSKTMIIRRAASYQADVLFDDATGSVQVSKGVETVVIQFNKQDKITQVSVFEIEVTFFGLHRRQLTPYILLNCHATNKS
ncbi:hypothetical protein SG34_030070 [Thalassomonas viridans]|uniref:Lipoprotein n=1 Tax=Thalassomonas viridans TaxID=137584 RepID=A0AAE9Z933_9GAMM|nr:hypothetical protein [Thalassomonas viridans]WDE09026.1 hypothetical protein SG34_030070 [Thalassomonas viridans]